MLEKIISEILKRYRNLTDEQRKSVARWDVPAYIVWTNQEDVVSTPCATLADLESININEDATVYFLSTSGYCNFFPAESSSVIGIALKRLLVVDTDAVIICTDKKYLDEDFEELLLSSKVNIIDSSGITIYPNGKVKWSREVPKRFSNALFRQHAIEENELKEHCLRILYSFPPSMTKQHQQTFNAIFNLNQDVKRQGDFSFDELKEFFSAISLGCLNIEKEDVNTFFTDNERWILQNIVFSKWIPPIGFHLTPEFEMAWNITMLWHESGVLPYIERDIPIEEQKTSIIRTSKKLGLDSSIEALKAGVNIEDILA